VKLRLDKLLVERGLAASRERAQALILAGKVLVDDQKIDKAGAQSPRSFDSHACDDLKFVSRGGLNWSARLDHWQIDVTGKVCLDVGASTGGFTDCLLQRGAERVIAVDTGYGQMDFNSDKIIAFANRKDECALPDRDAIGEYVDLIAMDVSFISARWSFRCNQLRIFGTAD